MTDPETIATYQSVADEYRELHADRTGVEGIVERFLTAVEGVAEGGARIADVGCGPGWESATFAERGHEVVGIDLTPNFLRAAREVAPAADFAQMDMRRLGFESDSFDGLWACASFLHVPREDAPDTLETFRRVLRPGGVCLLSVKHGDGEMSGDVYEEDGRRFTLYRADELRSMADSAGFTVESASVDATDSWVQLLARA
ncbi:ubiquinone biosynthesis methyltransferase UbiE [Haladaptatus sp. W1]|uniref:class I SAM-dependent methyltransferase n=1 Tax=Haladaptatus sp. W1 TaxID=1897478 RepID=UPI000849B6C5|nr:methyltransferase domain-containing protein [Haladaptatus sp. W1]ODR82245.1 ubiquinone biosynthesis methyltransferase UbiE [Haladaptatus sp. W1]